MSEIISTAEPIAPPPDLPAGRLQRLRTWLGEAAPALRSRNFRIFWTGQTVSTIGTSLQVVAEGWLVYSITQSTFWLGMVGLLGLLPVLPISLAGGVLIDRVPRRKLIMATQIGLLLQALVFGVLAITGLLRLPHIIVLYFIFGALLAIDHPARRAFLVELVDEKALANAVALNATVFNVSSLIGYAAAGILIATIGAGPTMMLNALTYIAPIIALALIRVVDRRADAAPSSGEKRSFIKAMSEGVTELWEKPALLGAVSLMAVVGGLAWPVFGMMPAYAEEVVQTGAIGLGILMACGAFGSVLGTVTVGRLGGTRRGHTMTIASIALPLLMIGFALTRNMWVAGILITAIGAVLLILQSLAITIVQLNISDRVRGRVMSIYSILHAGSDTMGNVAVGALATVIGLPASLALAAGAAGLYALGLRTVRPDVDQLD